MKYTLLFLMLLSGCGADGESIQGPAGPQGAQGEQGPPGEDGQDAEACNVIKVGNEITISCPSSEVTIDVSCVKPKKHK